MNSLTSNTPRDLPRLTFELNSARISALTPNRNKSIFIKNNHSPRVPPSPHSSISPRRRMQSFNKSGKVEINNPLERVRNILDVLDRNNSRDTIYCKCSNCCIFPKDIDKKSYNEAKFMKREYPSFFSNDRHFYLFLIKQFDKAIKGVTERYPDYYLSEPSKEEQINGLTAELDMWFTLFDECISQESTRSRSSAFILKNISDVFKSYFATLIEQVKNSHQKVQQIEEDSKKKFDEKSLISSLKYQIEFLKGEIERQKSEYQKLEDENSRFHVENFELKNEVKATKEDVKKLLKASDALEGEISQNQRRIYDLTLKHNIIPLDTTMGAVPDDILKIWDQSSQFLRDILDGTLESYDLNEIMPEAMFSPEIDYYIQMPKPDNYPREEDRIFHFTQLYKSIKFCAGETDPNKIFNTLELKVRNLYKKFGSFYYNRINWARKTQLEHISKLNNYNKDLRENIPDTSIVIKVLLENTNMFRYPKNPPDILFMIAQVFQKVPKLMEQTTKPRSAAEIVAKTFTGSDLILFLMLVAKQSKTDIFIDAFKKFVLNEFPFYAFIFFAKMCLELDGSDMKKRTSYMISTFSNVGFNSIPAKLRKSFESTYVPSAVNFKIFMIALYLFSIQKLSDKLADQINKDDIENSAAVFFKLNELQALDIFQYMTALSEKVDPTAIEFAAVAFDRKVQFDHLISDFNPDNSEIIDYINNFGKRPPKEERKKKKKPKIQSPLKPRSPPIESSKSDKSKANSLLIGNFVAMDENVDNLSFKDDVIKAKPEMADAGTGGDGFRNVLKIRINAKNEIGMTNKRPFNRNIKSNDQDKTFTKDIQKDEENNEQANKSIENNESFENEQFNKNIENNEQFNEGIENNEQVNRGIENNESFENEQFNENTVKYEQFDVSVVNKVPFQSVNLDIDDYEEEEVGDSEDNE